MTQHAISVVPVPAKTAVSSVPFGFAGAIVVTLYSGFQWRCSCKARGNTHDDHQTALNHGVIHTWISAPATRAIEREGGQA